MSSWTQTSPGRFERRPGGTELLHGHWHAHDASDVIATVAVHSVSLPDPTQIIARLKNTWLALRFQLPLIAATQDRTAPAFDRPFVYTAPTEAEANAWADETIKAIDGSLWSLKEYIARQQVDDHFVRLFYQELDDNRASLGLIAHHSALDGRGALQVLSALVEGLARPTASSNYEWGAEFDRLPRAPAFESGIRFEQLSPEGQRYLRDWAERKPPPEQMFSMPTISPLPSGPVQLKFRLHQLDEARTAALLANVKRRGYTMTEAYAALVQTAIVGATGQESAGRTLMSGDVIDVRRWLPPSTRIVGAGSTLSFDFTPCDALLAADAGLATQPPDLTSFWDVVKLQSAHHQVYRSSKVPVEIEFEQVGDLIEVFKAFGSFVPVMAGASIISAVGLVDEKWVEPEQGDISITDVNVSNLTHCAVNCMHGWTYRGRFNVQVQHEAGCFDESLMQRVFDRIVATVDLLCN